MTFSFGSFAICRLFILRCGDKDISELLKPTGKYVKVKKNIKEGIDKEAMGVLFKGRNFKHDESSLDVLYNQLISHGFQKSEFE
jgi:hypothetical protein